ncbi:SAFB-like transcription modulator isoform X2 [Aphis craccivora]|uniref:SAFB-like transcription modulator isoform X2 n=1 Tax=Aphis craccivora TaxID=307492 RepID=A0A6G0XZD5_APHCR|nr:SAFB-like transcription modulator isoform X2 [Aphis craccivora]
MARFNYDMLCSVCNDEESIIRFLQDCGVLHRNRTCKNSLDMLIWYGLPFLKIDKFIYWWSKELTSIKFCEDKLSMDHSTTVDWNNYSRKQWVFGRICRETLDVFMVMVPNRSADTLIPIIENHIAAGSIIISDCWKSYDSLKHNNAFQHMQVKAVQEHNKDDNNEDSINLTIGEDDIKLFADEEDTNIEKEDEVIGNQTDEKTSLIKQCESCHPVTSSRLSTGLVKSRRNATEKRSSIGDKLRSTHKEDKDISNAKPIINTLKDEKKEGEKQIKDKVETGNKQSNNSNAQQILNDTSKTNNSSLVRNIWVSGLSSITKATDLKQLFSKYGKVILLIHYC